MRVLLIVVGLLCSLSAPARAGLITGSFEASLASFTGGDGRLQAGDRFAGVLRLDTGYDYGYRIDEPQARFIWHAWDAYDGPPPTAPAPLPIFIGLQNLRTGERFEVQGPGSAYDYAAQVPPYSTIDFSTSPYGQRVEFGSYVASTSPHPFWTWATLALGAEAGALFDDFAPDMIEIQPGAVGAALSSAHYGRDGLEFELTLSRFTFGAPASVPEPGSLALVAVGLLAATSLRAGRPARPKAR